MPTRKEVAKTKQDYIQKKESSIYTSIASVSDQLLENILANLGDYKKTGKVNQRDLLKAVKASFDDNFPKIMRDTANAGKSLEDLNLVYFSTLIESNRLDDVKNSVGKSIDKNFGLNPDGTIKKNGFLDRAIDNKNIQKAFIKELNTALKGNPSIEVLTDKIKTFVTGNDLQGGMFERYYNTIAKNTLIQIDRQSNKIYMDELDLSDFIFGGGLIKTTRCFCLRNNGKIISMEQADKWVDHLEEPCGPVWNEKRDGKYNPLEQMGGHECRHTPEPVTPGIASDFKSENNKRASERNANFKEKHINS